MDAVNCEVQWSPKHEDKFLLRSSSLALYKVESLRDPHVLKSQVFALSGESQATLLAVNNEVHGVRCVEWCPTAQDTVIAVGLTTGKVFLTNFSKGTDASSLNGREMVPKHPRACLQIVWNPNDEALLAECLAFYKTDCSVLIYDVHQRFEIPGSPIHKATYELCMNEPVSSLAWFQSNPRCLIAWVNNRLLRIYDLRDTSRPHSTASTRAGGGIAVSPNSDHVLATHADDQLLLWDTRYFERPIHTMRTEDGQPHVRISWCPTRNNVLGCLRRGGQQVRLLDVLRMRCEGEQDVITCTERHIQPYGGDNTLVSWFSWHPTHLNKMLVVNNSAVMRELTVPEKIAMTWSPGVRFAWSNGREVHSLNTAQLSHSAGHDIALKIRRRAKRGYGIQSDLSRNELIAADNLHLKNLWRFLHYAKSLQQDTPKVSGSRPAPLLSKGIRAVLSGEGGQHPAQPQGQQGAILPGVPSSELDLLPWQLSDGHKLSTKKRIFRGEERTRALRLCCWALDKESPSLPYIDECERERLWERAAAVAVFTLRMARALQVLGEGARHQGGTGAVNLNMVAMALSGYYDDKNTLWRKMCANLHDRLAPDPYLRAMFAFLTCEDDSYENVLREDLAVSDKVAFACIYLPDAKLQDFIAALTKRLVDSGNLDGLCLTGLCGDGLTLLQHYIDLTGDVQTACVTSLLGLSNAVVAQDARVLRWIAAYRELLDTWGMWTERAEFDVYRQSMDSQNRCLQQVYACCNYCGKTIGYSPVSDLRRGYSTTSKVTSCPQCRKPLPRCSLCLINMGTPAGPARQPTSQLAITDGQNGRQVTPFSDWFTWCQSCRHGGHAHHIADWFSSGPDTECPVTGCSCRCSALDPVTRVTFDPQQGHTEVASAPT